MATTFTNVRRMATAQGSANGITIRGDFQINPDNRISNFNGQVSGENFNGYFNYSEREDGNFSYNVDGVPMAAFADVQNLVFGAVADIHAEFNKTEEE